MADFELTTAVIDGVRYNYVRRNVYPRIFVEIMRDGNEGVCEAGADAVLDPCTDAQELATAMRELGDYVSRHWWELEW